MPDGRGYRLTDHTADVVVEAWGPTRTACLEEVVAGCCAIFAGPATPTARVPLRVVAAVPEELVPSLLEEVIFALDTLDRVPIGAVISAESPTSAHGWIELGDREVVDIVGPAPKAVSRTGAALVPTGTGWRCRVMVDV
jgi:SHS2 domain-containing protein